MMKCGALRGCDLRCDALITGGVSANAGSPLVASAMRRMPRRRNVLQAACLALAVLCGACTNSGSHGSPGQARAAGHRGAAITVGSFDFPESVLLGYIYADALAAKGFPVQVLPDLGTRELVDPALMNGLIQLVPEYSGSALEFMSLGRQPATSDAAATYRSL